jgi:hypothetical protein
MKKLIVLLIVIALCACLFVGCDKESRKKDSWAGTGFVYIESRGCVEHLYYEDTGVMYVYDASGYAGGLTVLLNPDGTPMIWESK